MSVDMTGASAAEFEARIAPFEADERVERVAQALCTESFGAEFLDEQTPEWQDYLRRLAAAAIAALPPSPAEQAVRGLADEFRALADDSACGRGSWRQAEEYARAAALASPAPAPQGEEAGQ